MIASRTCGMDTADRHRASRLLQLQQTFRERIAVSRSRVMRAQASASDATESATVAGQLATRALSIRCGGVALGRGDTCEASKISQHSPLNVANCQAERERKLQAIENAKRILEVEVSASFLWSPSCVLRISFELVLSLIVNCVRRLTSKNTSQSLRPTYTSCS